MATSVLLGRNSAVSGFSSSGYIRDYSCAASCELADSTGIGGNAGGFGNAPFRDMVALFSGGTARVNALCSGSAPSNKPGDSASIDTDWYAIDGLITSCESSATYDNFVYVSATIMACNPATGV